MEWPCLLQQIIDGLGKIILHGGQLTQLGGSCLGFFSLPMAGAYQDQLAAAGGITGLQIPQAVTDHGAICQIEAVLAGGTVEQAGGWLAAVTNAAIRRLADIRVMRAVIDAIQAGALGAQQGGQTLMNGRQLRLARHAAGNHRLIGDNDHRYAGLIQSAQGRGGAGNEAEPRGIDKIIDFFDLGAVTIEKNGGFGGFMRGASHGGRS